MFNVVHIPETDSTNRWLREHGGEEELAVSTDYQTAGRGCGQNSWESERGQNLLFSVLLHPTKVAATDQFILSMANALALRDSLACYIDDVSIKWPNDIYWKDSKICGTLIETTLQGQHIKDCIIGTGINVNQSRFSSDAPNPVSLRQILGHEVNRQDLLQKVLDNLAKYMDMVGADIPSPREGSGVGICSWEFIRTHYRHHLYRREETWPYRFNDGSEKPCKLVDVTDDGHLLLQYDNRDTYRLAFKEVQFVI